MNKKLLFAAGALPLILAACNNELETISVEEQVNQTEIVGAKLVGNGLTIEVNRGEVASRIVDGKFVDGDQLGLAWYQGTNSSSIFAEQVLSGFSWENYGKNDAEAYQLIYGNHKFVNGGGSWATQSNVYEGFHFAYYPYTYMGQVSQMVISPNAEPQKGSFDDEAYNKAFWISAQDTILASSVKEDGTVKKQIDLVRAVNVLKFNIASNAPFSTADALKNLNITGVEIQTGGGDVTNMFYTGANIKPSYLPAAVYLDEDEDGVYTYDSDSTTVLMNTENALFGQAIELTGGSPLMKTEVATEAGLTLAQTNAVRMFLLPTVDVTLPEGGIAIYVYVPGGYFRIDAVGTTEKNKTALKNLRALLSEEGLKDSKNNVYKLSKLSYANLPVNIELISADFTPDFTSISNHAEWMGAVAIADALNIENPTFVVDGKVSITDAANFAVPAKGVTVETTGEKGEISIETKFTLPESLAKALNEQDKVVVKKNATLIIPDNTTLNANVDNKGTIEVGYKATAKTVNNKDGRINVIYGSYVEVKDEDSKGIIAYEVTGNDDAYQINYLTNSKNALGQAYVNTLVVSNGITFDLSMVDGDVTDNDPYNGKVDEGKTLERMDVTNFELNNGSIKANVNTGVSVKSVKVVGGTINEIRNIDVTEGLTVEAGKAKVDVDAVSGYKASVNMGSIEVKANAELNVNTNVYVNTISNPKGAKTIVADPYTVWYSTEYVQGGNADGNINEVVALSSTTGSLVLATSVSVKAENDANGGKAGLVVAPGESINGGVNNTLNVTGANGTNDAAIAATGGTIKNINIEGAFRGVYGTLTNDLTIEKANINNVCYTINVTGSGNLNVKESTLNGWTSFAVTSATFTKCNFGKGIFTGGKNNTTYTNEFMRPYNNTTFVNCTFSKDYKIGVGATGLTYTFKNCKYEDGSAVTSSIFKKEDNIDVTIVIE